MAGYLQAALSARRDWAEGLSTLQFAAEFPPFDAGQWVNLALEVNGKVVRRAYSLASAPGAPPEVFITRVPDGALSPHLFDLKPGNPLMMEGVARGFFTLKFVPEARDLWLLATGTGLGPFIAMLRTEEPWRRFQRIVVVHGVREHAHLAYREELLGASTAHGGRSSYVPIVSRETPADGVLRGRITAALMDGSLEHAAGVKLDPAHSHLMLCGNPQMIMESMTLLETRGLHRHRVRKPGHITIEKYW